MAYTEEKSSIVIPVYNRMDLVSDLMLALDKLFHIRHDFEVITINNGSKDRSAHILHWWKHNADWRMVTRNFGKPLGFAGAVNTGAKMAREEFLFIVTTDVVVKGDFLDSAIGWLESHSEDYIVSPRVVDWAAGWNEFPGIHPIPYAEGWLLSMRKNVWDDLGGLDTRYNPHDYEDIDLSYAAAQKGVKVQQIDMPVEHLGAGTIGYTRKRLNITKRNRKKFAKKWGLQWAPVRE